MCACVYMALISVITTMAMRQLARFISQYQCEGYMSGLIFDRMTRYSNSRLLDLRVKLSRAMAHVKPPRFREAYSKPRSLNRKTTGVNLLNFIGALAHGVNR